MCTTACWVLPSRVPYLVPGQYKLEFLLKLRCYYANLLLPQTALEFAQGYRARSGQSLVPDYAYYVFDAVWATAMALNNSSEVNNTGEVRRAFRNLEFTGVSVSLSSYKVTWLVTRVNSFPHAIFTGSSEAWNRWNTFTGQIERTSVQTMYVYVNSWNIGAWVFAGTHALIMYYI